MPIYTIQSPDGRTVKLEGDTPPTDQDLDDVFASLPAKEVSEKEKFTKEFISSAQKPALSKILSGTGDLASGLAKTAKGGATGLYDILSEAAAQTKDSPLGGLATTAAAVPNILQSIIEGGGRALTDTYEAGKQLGPYLSDLIEGRAQPPSLLGRTPTSLEARSAFERSQFGKTQPSRAEGETVVPEIIGKANVPLSEFISALAGEESALPALGRRGAIQATKEAVQGAVGAGGRGISTVKARGLLSKPFEDVVTKTTGITAQEGSLDLLSNAVPRIKETLKGLPSSASDVVKVSRQTGKDLLEMTNDALKNAENSGLQMDKNLLRKNAEEVLSQSPEFSLFTPEELTKVVDDVMEKFPDKISPTKGKDFLVAENASLDQFHPGTQSARRKMRTDPKVAAELAVTRSLSDQLDDLYKLGSGLDESPYRDYGSVKEFADSVNDQIIKAQKAQGKSSTSLAGGTNFSKPGLIAGALKALPVTRGLVAREIEAIDSGARRIFKDIPKKAKTPAISQDFINSKAPIYGGVLEAPQVP